ncbi:hypothetical protein [Salinivibrio proteolyticus]|uniref:hypothetical protein n=1 Tax=Salinivibrio proteolyticus TaxID=334715 RepID=UPI001428B22D|nr:hypothetical protein [Salinivibrio proteolyticus]
MSKSNVQSYPVLKPFRLNKRWVKSGTVSLLPAQAYTLQLNGKIGKAKTANNKTSEVKS